MRLGLKRKWNFSTTVTVHYVQANTLHEKPKLWSIFTQGFITSIFSSVALSGVIWHIEQVLASINNYVCCIHTIFYSFLASDQDQVSINWILYINKKWSIVCVSITQIMFREWDNNQNAIIVNPIDSEIRISKTHLQLTFSCSDCKNTEW